MKSGIYIIKNSINNSVYIGSSKYIKARISQHKYAFRNNNNSNKYLQEFYNKHGLNVFSFGVLEYCGIELLKSREQYFLNLFSNKFNISEFSTSTKGVKCSEEKKNLISIGLKNAGLKGVKKSEETKKRMSKPKSTKHRLNIKKAQEKTVKKVFQYTLELTLITDHRSITDASKNTGVKRGCISACCNNRQNTAQGFIWSFKKL